VKNVKNGLKARTRILNALEQRASSAASVAKEKSLSYGVVMHHLRLLENEGTVNRKGKRPYFWLLTGLGQKRLIR
jgi:predicted transcriptional regulator